MKAEQEGKKLAEDQRRAEIHRKREAERKRREDEKRAKSWIRAEHTQFKWHGSRRVGSSVAASNASSGGGFGYVGAEFH